MTKSQKDALIDRVSTRWILRISIDQIHAFGNALCLADELRKLKERVKNPSWPEILSNIGINEIHARYLLNLIEEYDRFIRNGGSSLGCMEKFLNQDVLEKLSSYDSTVISKRGIK